MAEDDSDKDKAKEAAAGQQQTPEVALTPDQQANQEERADASAVDAANGPVAGLGELADSNHIDAGSQPPENGVPVVGGALDGDKKAELSRLSGNLETVAQQQEEAAAPEPEDIPTGDDVEPPQEQQFQFNDNEIAHMNWILSQPDRDARIAGLDPGGRMRIDAYQRQGIMAPTNPDATPTGADTNIPDAANDADQVLAEARRSVLGEQSDEGEWDDMEPDELKDGAGEVNEQIKILQRALTDYRTTPERAAQFQSQIDSLKTQKREMQKVYRKKTGNTVNVTEDEQRRLGESIRAAAKETARISTLPVEKRQEEIDSASKTVEALQSQLLEEQNKPGGEQNPARLKALNDEIANAKAHESVLKAGFDEKKTEAENKKKEEEAAKQSEDYEKQQLNTANSADIQARLDNLAVPLADIQKQIREIEREMADPTTTDARKLELTGARNKLLPDAIDLQKKVGELKDAHTKAQKREADTLKPGEAGRFEPLKNISSAEWAKMTDEQKQNHLKELGKDKGNLTHAEFNEIRRKIRSGEDLSVEQSARYAKELGNRLIQDGRRGYDQKELAMLKATNPDVYNAAMERYINSESAKAQLKELFPSNWEKVLRFAKGKSWLIALLILMGGAATVGAGKQFGKFMDNER